MTGQTHSMSVLKRAIDGVASRGRKVIDTRTRVGKALMAWRAQLVEDLGGAEQLSTQQLALVDISMRTKLLLDSVDAWLLRQPSIIDKRRRHSSRWCSSAQRWPTQWRGISAPSALSAVPRT